jgi:hypothetical protein
MCFDNSIVIILTCHDRSRCSRVKVRFLVRISGTLIEFQCFFPHYILQYCHGDSTVYIFSHWIKSIWSLGNWDSYIVYYATKFFHHFYHWEVIKMTTLVAFLAFTNILKVSSKVFLYSPVVAVFHSWLTSVSIFHLKEDQCLTQYKATTRHQAIPPRFLHSLLSCDPVEVSERNVDIRAVELLA